MPNKIQMLAEHERLLPALNSRDKHLDVVQKSGLTFLVSMTSKIKIRTVSETSDDFIVFEGDHDVDFERDGEDNVTEDSSDSDDDESMIVFDKEGAQGGSETQAAVFKVRSDGETEDSEEFDFEDDTSEVIYGDNSNELHSKHSRNRSDGEEEQSHKKVKFNLKPEIHQMIQWDFAYRAARKGPWEMYARDRDRFKYRILNTERALGPIFSDQHRSHIWQQRFPPEIEKT